MSRQEFGKVNEGAPEVKVPGLHHVLTHPVIDDDRVDAMTGTLKA
ncbi:hypothetical protein [Streptomyces sp. NPDC007172]